MARIKVYPTSCLQSGSRECTKFGCGFDCVGVVSTAMEFDHVSLPHGVQLAMFPNVFRLSSSSTERG